MWSDNDDTAALLLLLLDDLDHILTIADDCGSSNPQVNQRPDDDVDDVPVPYASGKYDIPTPSES